MTSRAARIIFITACFVLPLGAIIFVTRGDLSQASVKMARLFRGDDQSTLVVFVIMLLILVSILAMWFHMRGLIPADATGEYCGHVLTIAPGEEANRARDFMAGMDGEGKLFEQFSILNRGLYARPDDDSVQPFLITGFLMKEPGILLLLGHCAALRKPQPDPGSPYNLVIRGKFELRESDITAGQVAGYTSRLYARLSEELGRFVREKERLRKLILMGTQLGHWFLSGDYELEEMRTVMLGQDIKGPVFDHLMLTVLEALERTPFDPATRKAAVEFLGPARFSDKDLERRRDKLRRVLRVPPS